MFQNKDLLSCRESGFVRGDQSMISYATAPFLGATLAALALVMAGIVFIFQQVIAERRYVRLRAEYEARRAAYFAAEFTVVREAGDDLRVVDEGVVHC
jgi:hypothetical protein